MQRWHKEAAHSRRENLKHLRQVHGWPKKEVDCVCDTQIGRFRKSKGLGCRKLHCLVCKWEKLLNIPTYKDRIAEVEWNEALESLKYM